MSSFEATDVTVVVGGSVALDTVSIDVGAGEIVAVVGGDGAGKTTLARVLAGLIESGGGTVTFPAGATVGYQPEGSGVWPDLTVAENLAFVASAFRLPRRHAAARMEELIDAIGLDEAVDRLGSRLSGGMRQKLGVAMALVPGPDLLVLDEPTTGVDPVSRFDLWRLVSEAAAEGAAVVMTTTYLDEAERASRILALDDGRMLARGSLESIVTSLPGVVYTAADAADAAVRWRRGAAWRAWGETAPHGATTITPDLGDVLTALALSGKSVTAP